MLTIKNERINEEIYVETLNNGLKVYYYPKTGFTKKYAVFSTGNGSCDNKFKIEGKDESITLPDGIAHFLEHKLFEDPEKDFFEKFSGLGADVNAFTSFNQTSYLFSTTENFIECLLELVNLVMEPFFTDENVEKEKGIIAQEIQMYQDSPNWKVFFNLLDGLYVKHPIKIDIAGSIDSISKIDKDNLYLAYKLFYNPESMVLVLVGDIDFQNVINELNTEFAKYNTERLKGIKIYENEPTIINKKRIEEKMSTSLPIFNIGIKDVNVGITGKEAVKKDIISNLILEILFSRSSEFYQELYTEGLIDDQFGAYYTGKTDYGHSIISGTSENPDEVYERIVKLFKNPDKYLTEDGFERIKKKQIGQFLIGLNSVEYIAHAFTDLYFQDFLLIDYIDLYDEINFKMIKDRFDEHFNIDRLCLSLIVPE
ncbi:insulinase family protein [Soehngenia saccharolytica]|nr:insulinase family protein [Soehngenia saccharolytica]